jgi:hypothetical protein
MQIMLSIYQCMLSAVLYSPSLLKKKKKKRGGVNEPPDSFFRLEWHLHFVPSIAELGQPCWGIRKTDKYSPLFKKRGGGKGTPWFVFLRLEWRLITPTFNSWAWKTSLRNSKDKTSDITELPPAFGISRIFCAEREIVIPLNIYFGMNSEWRIPHNELFFNK